MNTDVDLSKPFPLHLCWSIPNQWKAGKTDFGVFKAFFRFYVPQNLDKKVLQKSKICANGAFKTPQGVVPQKRRKISQSVIFAAFFAARISQKNIKNHEIRLLCGWVVVSHLKHFYPRELRPSFLAWFFIKAKYFGASTDPCSFGQHFPRGGCKLQVHPSSSRLLPQNHNWRTSPWILLFIFNHLGPHHILGRIYSVGMEGILESYALLARHAKARQAMFLCTVQRTIIGWKTKSWRSYSEKRLDLWRIL